MASTVATFKAVKMYGSAVGKRTRRKISSSPAAYERMSSIWLGRTDVSPRSVFTNTGKKTSTAAIAIFEAGLSSPNQLFVIGAKAMIGIALAAIANGISAPWRRRQRAGATPRRIAAAEPITKPPSASLKVNQPAAQSVSRSFQTVSRMVESGGQGGTLAPPPPVLR